MHRLQSSRIESPRDLWLRVKSQWESLPSLVPAVALLVLALALAASLLRNPQSETRVVPLFAHRDLSPLELESVEMAVGAANLQDYVIRSGQLYVPEIRRSDYFAVIQSANCLDGLHSPTANAIREATPWELGTQRDQRWQHAREEQVRLALLRIHGVHDAQVQFDEHVERGISERVERSASVVIETAPDAPLDLPAFRVIRDIVLGAKAGLKPEQITIADVQARRVLRGSVLDTPSPVADELARQGLEREWEHRLKPVLAFVPNAQLVVCVDLPSVRDTNMVAPADPRLRVSVNVPTSYLEAVRIAESAHAMHRETTPKQGTTEDRARREIQHAVASLLPRTNQGERQHDVIVNFFTDTTHGNSPSAPTPVFVSWHVLPIIVVMAAGVWGWFHFRHAEPEVEHPTQLKVFASEEDAGPATSTQEDVESLRDRLQTLVDEDPDAAAKSLTDWIDQAS